MGLDRHMKILTEELEHFTSILNEILPRYTQLVQKLTLNDDEIKELGDIEHFLIEVNGKIAEIKSKLDQDLFGETMNLYYIAKEKAIKGDVKAIKQLDVLRNHFQEGLKGDLFFNWN